MQNQIGQNALEIPARASADAALAPRMPTRGAAARPAQPNTVSLRPWPTLLLLSLDSSSIILVLDSLSDPYQRRCHSAGSYTFTSIISRGPENQHQRLRSPPPSRSFLLQATHNLQAFPSNNRGEVALLPLHIILLPLVISLVISLSVRRTDRILSEFFRIGTGG